MIVIDRFEGDFAVLNIDGKTADIPKKYMPEGAKEGCRLKFTLDDTGGRAAIAEKQNRLFR